MTIDLVERLRKGSVVTLEDHNTQYVDAEMADAVMAEAADRIAEAEQVERSMSEMIRTLDAKCAELEAEVKRLSSPTWWAGDDEDSAETPDDYAANSESYLEVGEEIELTPWRELGPSQTFRIAKDSTGRRYAEPVVPPVDLEAAGQLRLETK